MLNCMMNFFLYAGKCDDFRAFLKKTLPCAKAQPVQIVVKATNKLAKQETKC